MGKLLDGSRDQLRDYCRDLDMIKASFGKLTLGLKNRFEMKF